MSGTRDPFRLQDLLDGLLTENQAQELVRDLEADPALNREFRWMQAVHRLLDEPLDVDPPADLEASILAAIRAPRTVPPAAPRRIRVPRWAENSLILAGATSLAAVIGVGRTVGPDWIGPLMGKAVVGVADILSFVTQMAVNSRELDWALRLVSTLSQAGWTVLGSSADALMFVGMVSVALSTVAAWGLTRGGRILRGGTGHAHLLS